MSEVEWFGFEIGGVGGSAEEEEIAVEGELLLGEGSFACKVLESVAGFAAGGGYAGEAEGCWGSWGIEEG